MSLGRIFLPICATPLPLAGQTEPSPSPPGAAAELTPAPSTVQTRTSRRIDGNAPAGDSRGAALSSRVLPPVAPLSGAGDRLSDAEFDAWYDRHWDER